MSIHLNRKDSKSNKKCKQGLSLGGRVMDNINFLPCIFLYLLYFLYFLLPSQDNQH